MKTLLCIAILAAGCVPAGLPLPKEFGSDSGVLVEEDVVPTEPGTDAGPLCGNASCNVGLGEDDVNCPEDCGCSIFPTCVEDVAPAGCQCRPNCGADCCADACEVCGWGCP